MNAHDFSAISPAESARRLTGLVEGYFARYGKPKRGSRILVAVSGGPDSMALLESMLLLSQKCQWTIGIAHVNHCLRGTVSDGDETFIREVAERKGLAFHSTRLEPEDNAENANTQMWARMARYDFLERTADRYAYDHIAVAHHLDDRAETVAAAVLDGGGTFALSGIPPERGKIIRPLFSVPKDLILEYLAESGIEFRIDESNQSTRYQRNRIRLHVLPDWKRENPNIIEGLARLGERVWEQRRYLESHAEQIVASALIRQNGPTLTLDARRLRDYDCALDAFVLRILAGRVRFKGELKPATVARFSALRRHPNGSGKVEQGQLEMTLSKSVLQLEIKQKTGPLIERRVDAQLETREVEHRERIEHDDGHVAQFDLDTVKGQPTLRSPLPGDRYQPVGLSGTKKLADLLADRGVPVFERLHVALVVDDLGILWPVGHPIAHRARLTSHTRRVLEARVLEGSWKTS